MRTCPPCDSQCRQGRDCPADVARIGRRYWGYSQPQEPSRTPGLLRKATWMVLSGIFGLLFYAALILALVID